MNGARRLRSASAPETNRNQQKRGCLWTLLDFEVVPLAGIEPALLAESDFESDASTSSAIGARDDTDGADIERRAA
jgi:hypothetical protein